MAVVHFIAVGLLLVIAQTTVCMPTPIWLPAPDFYYILVAYLALRLDMIRGLFILLPLICILDTLSGTVLGIYALLCLTAYLLLRAISSKMPVSEHLYQLPLVALSYLLVSWLVYMLLSFLDPGQLTAWSWWRMGVRTLLIGLFTWPLFFCFDLVLKFSSRSFLPFNRLRMRTDNRRRQT